MFSAPRLTIPTVPAPTLSWQPPFPWATIRTSTPADWPAEVRDALRGTGQDASDDRAGYYLFFDTIRSRTLYVGRSNELFRRFRNYGTFNSMNVALRSYLEGLEDAGVTARTGSAIPVPGRGGETVRHLPAMYAVWVFVGLLDRNSEPEQFLINRLGAMLNTALRSGPVILDS